VFFLNDTDLEPRGPASIALEMQSVLRQAGGM
jgi:hypothetical protein